MGAISPKGRDLLRPGSASPLAVFCYDDARLTDCRGLDYYSWDRVLEHLPV